MRKAYTRKDRGKLIELGRNAIQESTGVEFKAKLEVKSKGEWIELVKDIVAIANSGGGLILIGVNDDATPSGFDCTEILQTDLATVVNKIYSFTKVQFSDFEIIKLDKNGYEIAIFLIYGISIPMIFVHPGEYDVGEKYPKKAFARGTLYFRHGPKSEHGSSDDLREVIEREVERHRKSWLGNIRQVMYAPPGSSVEVVAPTDVRATSDPKATKVRIVDDSTAPVYKVEDPNDTHPHRQKEVIEILNNRLDLKGKDKLNQYHLLSVRRVYQTKDKRPDFVYRPRFGSAQYSNGFINWLIDNYKDDASFFIKAKVEYSRIRKALSTKDAK